MSSHLLRNQNPYEKPFDKLPEDVKKKYTFEDELDNLQYKPTKKDIEDVAFENAYYAEDIANEKLEDAFFKTLTPVEQDIWRLADYDEPFDIHQQKVFNKIVEKYKTYSKWKKQVIDDYPNQKARDKGDAQDFAENNPRDKELESDNDFLKNKNSQRRKQFDKLPEDVKKKYTKEYEQLKYEQQQEINKTDVWEWWGDYDDVDDYFEQQLWELNKKYGISPFFDMGPDFWF